ncbi:hypothetical protein DPMN_089957 [Dreissena polymorpha]|uniref:Uncharacterized protein n=1 Tax=Dreissena polymorpha TaxID=45954 RepID=A0A9D4KXR7_DREPO|nr:hypothetical protein DPMN_089957 [Dreissena polymorpha]
MFFRTRHPPGHPGLITQPTMPLRDNNSDSSCPFGKDRDLTFKQGTEILSTTFEMENAQPPWRQLTSRNYIMKNAPLPCGHVFHQVGTIFKLIQAIIRTKVLNKFREDLTINVTPRVLTKFYYSHTGKNDPPSGGHDFQLTGTIFELAQNIIWKSLLTIFHKDQTIN